MTDAHTEQLKKIRREAIRWHVLATLNISRPSGMNLGALLPIICSVYPDCTALELKRELDALHDMGLAALAIDSLDNWFAELTAQGLHVVEYAVPCPVGLTRPRAL